LYMSSVGNSTFTNPITINAGTTGAISMTGAGNFNYTFSGSMALNNSLILGSTQCRFIFSGLVTETDSSPITINRALGHANVIFSGGIVIGSNGLTLLNGSAGVSGALSVSGGITGTGNLTLQNDSTNTTAVTLSGVLINNTGTIANVGTNIGSAWISAVIGPNVTGVVQNSATSPLVLSGTNTYTGTTTINLGTLETQKTNCLSAASSVVIAATGAQMFLNFNGTNTINSLKIGNSNMKKGVYGSGLLQPTYFSGNGALKVMTGPSDATIIRFF